MTVWHYQEGVGWVDFLCVLVTCAPGVPHQQNSACIWVFVRPGMLTGFAEIEVWTSDA